jgi:hypothetical protein
MSGEILTVASEEAPIDHRAEVVKMIEGLSSRDPNKVTPMPELSPEQHNALREMLTESGIELDPGENGEYLASLRELRFRARVDNLSFKKGRGPGFLHALRGRERAVAAINWAHEQAMLHEWNEEIRDDENARGRSIQQAMADFILIGMDKDPASRNRNAIARLNQRVKEGWEKDPNITADERSALQERFTSGHVTSLGKLRGIPPGSAIDVWHFLRGEVSK